MQIIILYHFLRKRKSKFFDFSFLNINILNKANHQKTTGLQLSMTHYFFLRSIIWTIYKILRKWTCFFIAISLFYVLWALGTLSNVCDVCKMCPDGSVVFYCKTNPPPGTNKVTSTWPEPLPPLVLFLFFTWKDH